MFDVVVIGAGPGGYVAAIRAAQLGLKTACIEKGSTLGGTCLNVGCIPSKTLLHASELYHIAQHDMQKFGVQAGNVSIDLSQMMAKKDEVVDGLTKGIAGLFKKNGIEWIRGTARFEGPDHLVVDDGQTVQRIEGKHTIIATGSSPIELPFLKFDEKTIVSSTGALSFAEVPAHLVVIGGGVIGLELGSVWLRLGAQVTVVEFLDRVAPGLDDDLSRELLKTLKRQGMKFHLSTKATGIKASDTGVVLTAESKSGALELAADKVLVSVGRKPHTSGLGLEKAGVALDGKGRIEVDGRFKTNVPGIYAIGDVIQGPMLAHKAEEDGVACVELIAGKAGHVNYNLVPSIIYTHPEVAAVGQTESELKAAGVAINVGKFPFKANARGRCVNDDQGFIKLIADAQTDRLLGAHMIGPQVSELIQELVLAMEFGGSAEDVARTVHGHPTLFEAVKEAALDVDNRTIHI
ncbi:MAG: dihydrolipoyl dehydrogenase [Acidobacteria bacterium]|nr:dihydrolipoyl dehydrogenase [Acidobacteriota bacterium]